MAENDELDELFSQARKRFADLQGRSPSVQHSFLEHLRSLGSFSPTGKDWQPYLQQPVQKFPETLPIAFAVCDPDCGTQEFIVEGSTQECQKCGRNMFRLETKEYRKV